MEPSLSSMPGFSNEKEFEKKSASYIVNEIESKKYSLIICEWACRAFANISAVAMQNHSPELCADFLDGGACEVLVSIMYKYSSESQIVACYGCATILHLAWSSRDLREFFGEISACEIVVHSISMHIGDPDVSEYGSGAVGILSKQNISNSYKLTQAGACEVMVQVGNFGFCLRHPRCQNVAANVCFALTQFSEAVNSTKLLECGACDLITQLMRLHNDIERVVKRAVRAICALASLNFKLREALGQCGACELVIAAVGRYGHNINIVQEGCEAMMHLSLNPGNTQRIGEAGGCVTIVNSLQKQLMEHYFGAEVCCGAMVNLVTYGTAAMENRARLIEAGAIEQIKRSKMSTKASYRSRESGSQLLEILGDDSSTASTSRSRGSSSPNVAELVTSSSNISLDSAIDTSAGNSSNGSADAKAVDAPIATTHNQPTNAPSDAPSTNTSNGMISTPVLLPSGNVQIGVGGPVNAKGRSNSFRGIVLGSEAKDGTVPLNVELRVYESFLSLDTDSLPTSPKANSGTPLYMTSPTQDLEVHYNYAHGTSSASGKSGLGSGHIGLGNYSSSNSVRNSIHSNKHRNSNDLAPILPVECDSNGMLEV